MEAAATIELDGQYRALREQAGVVERGERHLLEIGGADAAEYLQGQLTNDVEALSPGEGCYTALLDRKGHMQGDMRVLRLAEARILLDVEGIAGDAVMRHLDMYRVGRDVTVADVSGEHALLSVIGPAAIELLGLAPLAPEHAHREEEIAAAPALAVATDLGVDLLVPSAAAESALAAVVSDGVDPASEAAAEIVRVESGRPRFGREMSAATIPQEAGINERAVSFSKGCYIGQETVARLHYRGKPNRRLRGLRLSAPAAAGEPVVLGERELGTIGTAVVSPAHGPIALAILRREAEPGATVSVGGAIEAEVVEPPF